MNLLENQLPIILENVQIRIRQQINYNVLIHVQLNFEVNFASRKVQEYQIMPRSKECWLFSVGICEKKVYKMHVIRKKTWKIELNVFSTILIFQWLEMYGSSIWQMIWNFLFNYFCYWLLIHIILSFLRSLLFIYLVYLMYFFFGVSIGYRAGMTNSNKLIVLAKTVVFNI